MEIKKTAMAGSMESSDCMVTVRPGTHGIQIDLQSDVKVMFGESILATVRQTLEELAVADAEVSVLDRGALDCVIRARVQCAACRAAETSWDWSKEVACLGCTGNPFKTNWAVCKRMQSGQHDSGGVLQ